MSMDVFYRIQFSKTSEKKTTQTRVNCHRHVNYLREKRYLVVRIE